MGIKIKKYQIEFIQSFDPISIPILLFKKDRLFDLDPQKRMRSGSFDHGSKDPNALFRTDTIIITSIFEISSFQTNFLRETILMMILIGANFKIRLLKLSNLEHMYTL